MEGGLGLALLKTPLTPASSRMLLPEWVPLFSAHISLQTAGTGQRL